MNRRFTIYDFFKIILCFFVLHGALLASAGHPKGRDSGIKEIMSPSGAKLNVKESLDNPKVPVSGLSNGYGFTLRTGDTRQMSVEVTPEDATESSVMWSTSDESVACIDGETGLLTAKSPGVVKVMVTALDGSGIKDSCTVNVIGGRGEWKLTSNRKVTNPTLSYYLYFEKDAYTISVYGKGSGGYYSKLVKTINSSRGRTLSMTPTGIFKLSRQKRWYQFKIGLYWTQYCIRYSGDLYLHGPLYREKSGDTLCINEYNMIGTASTAGCLAMATADIKWIWDHCQDGTTLEIAGGAQVGNLAPAPPRIPPDGPAIDPTDPVYKVQ